MLFILNLLVFFVWSTALFSKANIKYFYSIFCCSLTGFVNRYSNQIAKGLFYKHMISHQSFRWIASLQLYKESTAFKVSWHCPIFYNEFITLKFIITYPFLRLNDGNFSFVHSHSKRDPPSSSTSNISQFF